MSKENGKYNNKSTKRKVRKIMEKMFLRVSDVEEILGVSESYAYKLIRKLNKEMQDMGFQTIQGRIDTKFFYEHFYQTKNYERRDVYCRFIRMTRMAPGMQWYDTRTGRERISKSAREDLRQGVRLWSGRHSSSCRKLLISI